MNSDLPITPREELEARLTALLLGEVSAEEAATLRAIIKIDPQLTAAYERLSTTAGLIRETAHAPIEQTASSPAQLKLAEDRRQKLLAHFKTVTPSAFRPPPQRRFSWLIPTAAAAAIVVLLGGALLPALSKAKSRGMEARLVNRTANTETFAAARLPDLAAVEGGRPLSTQEKVANEAGFWNRIATPDGKKLNVPALDVARGDDSGIGKSLQNPGPPGIVLPPQATPGTTGVETWVAKDQDAGKLSYFYSDLNRNGRSGAEATPKVEVLPPTRGGAEYAAKPRAVTDEKEDLVGSARAVGNGVNVQPQSVEQLGILPDIHHNRGYGTFVQPQPVQPQPGVATSFSVPLEGRVELTPQAGSFGGGSSGGGFTAGAPAKLPNAGFLPPPQSQAGVAVAGDVNVTTGVGPPKGDSSGVPNYDFTDSRSGGVANVPPGSPVSPAEPVQAAPQQRVRQLLETAQSGSEALDRGAKPPAANAPVLGEVPLVGKLFQSDSDDKELRLKVETAERLSASAGSGGEAGKALEDRFSTKVLPTDQALQFAQASGRMLSANRGELSKDVEAITANDLRKQASESKKAAIVAALDKSKMELPRGPQAPELLKSKNLPAQIAVNGRGTYYGGGTFGGYSRVEPMPGLLAARSAASTPPAENQPVPAEKLVELQEEDLARKTVSPALVPQPEVPTAENPFSTFSLNVSDVSFKLAAASLEQGTMPDAGNIRSEEFINAFDYRDPDPAPGQPIGFAWERARYPFAQNRDLLRFSIKTAAEGRQPGRPLNLVLLLDKSGSMERADRVRIIREALRVLAGQLHPQDKLSVVLFARTPRLLVDGVSAENAQAIAEEISNLTPDGGTNLGEALNLAYQTALRHYLANGVNRIVLLTDGAANLGDVDPESLKQKVEAHRKQGIALDCFGVGWEGYNDDLLEVLSRNGDGRYGFINSPDQAATEFVGQLAGALRVAASDVKVQVEFNPNRVNAYRQIGYAKHQLTKEQFRDNTVDAAEIGVAESGNALYTVEVNPQGSGPLAVVRVRYKVPGTADYHGHEWTVAYTGNAVALEQSSPALHLAAAASAFAEWLASSPYAGEVTLDRLLNSMSGIPQIYSPDPRPAKLEWMIRQAKSVSGK